MGYYSSRSNSDILPIWLCIILIIVCLLVSSACNDSSIQSSREKQNMIPIEEGFAYDAETKIIYREYISGRSKYSYDTTSYTPYFSENGNYYQYIEREWAEMINEQNLPICGSQK